VNWKQFPHVGFNVDLLISSKGARKTGQLKTDSSNFRWNSYLNLVYLESPLLFELYPGKNDHSFQPRLVGGISTAILLITPESIFYNQSISNSNFDPTFKTSTESATYKTGDIGLIYGMGFTYRIGDHTLFSFDTRYTYGLTDIKTNSKSTPWKNRAITVLLGICYKISK